MTALPTYPAALAMIQDSQGNPTFVSGTNPLPVTSAGGSGGAVTIADGADVTQGAMADIPVTNVANPASLIALTKGLITLLGTMINGMATAAYQNAGNNLLTEINDQILVSTQALQTTLTGGTQKVAGATWNLETSTPLTANVVFTGPARAVTASANYFYVESLQNQAGTLSIKKSVDGGTTFFQVASIAITAGTTIATLKVPIAGGYYQVVFTNGSTAQGTFILTSSFMTA